MTIIKDGTEVLVRGSSPLRGVVLESKYHHAWRIVYLVMYKSTNTVEEAWVPEDLVCIAPPVRPMGEPPFDLDDMELAEIIMAEASETGK